MELSLPGESVLKANLPSAVLTGRGGVRAGAAKMLGGKHGGLNHFTECPVGPSAVLRCCRGVESLEALQSCPGVAASGYSFAQPSGMSGAGCWAAPRGTN